MAGDKELRIKYLGDASNALGELNKLDKAHAGFGDNLNKHGKKLAGFGTNMTKWVSLPIAGIGLASFKAASDVNESLSKVNAVFGENGKQIDAWSKGTAKSIGLSKGAALDAAGGFGNMFTQLGIGGQQAAQMSTKIVGLAADFASFHNADISEVITAQSAAFRGEYDALQRFLPLINAATVEQKAMAMSGKDNAKELTAQEKALAVNALMFEGAGKAQGDFARTSEGAANKQRILKAQLQDTAAEIGTRLLPMGQKALEWASGMLDKWEKLSPATQDFAVKAALVAAALGPIAIVGGKTASGIGSLVNVFGSLGAKLPGISGKGPGKLGGVCDELDCVSGGAGKASGALGGLSKSFGVLGAAIVGAAIGKKIEESFVRPTIAAVQSANDITASNTLAMQNRFIGAMAKMGASSAQIAPVNRVLNEMQSQGNLTSASMFNVFQNAQLIGQAAAAGLSTAAAVREIGKGGDASDAAVARLRRQIDGLPSNKTVTIKTVFTGGGGGDFGGKGASGKFHAGGLVMHKGGLIPRYHAGALAGDEVPAILQRGEFVMQRKAVDAWGVDAMRKMNAGGSPGGISVGNLNVNVPAGTDGTAFARQMVSEFQRMQNRGEPMPWKN